MPGQSKSFAPLLEFLPMITRSYARDKIRRFFRQFRVRFDACVYIGERRAGIKELQRGLVAGQAGDRLIADVNASEPGWHAVVGARPVTR